MGRGAEQEIQHFVETSQRKSQTSAGGGLSQASTGTYTLPFCGTRTLRVVTAPEVALGTPGCLVYAHGSLTAWLGIAMGGGQRIVQSPARVCQEQGPLALDRMAGKWLLLRQLSGVVWEGPLT